MNLDNKYFDEWESKIQLSNLINYIKRKTIEYEYNISFSDEYIKMEREIREELKVNGRSNGDGRA